MKTKSLTWLLPVAALAMTSACSEDPNDGDIFDFSPNPVGPVCMEVGCLSSSDCTGSSTVAAVSPRWLHDSAQRWSRQPEASYLL